MTITFTVPLEPVPQPRVRAAKKGNHASVYTPTTIKTPTGSQPHPIVEFRSEVRRSALDAYDGELLDGPVRVDCVFVFKRPSAKIWKKRPMPRYRHTGKKDRDNLDKAVLDSLTGIIFRDDGQVCDGRIQKWVAAGDERPHAEVTITTLNGDE